jgi:hypothetical protein
MEKIFIVYVCVAFFLRNMVQTLTLTPALPSHESVFGSTQSAVTKGETGHKLWSIKGGYSKCKFYCNPCSLFVTDSDTTLLSFTFNLLFHTSRAIFLLSNFFKCVCAVHALY